jgi:O-antigen/teichoic acid export membrane protein
MIGTQGKITQEAQVTARNMSAVLLLKVVQYPFLVLSALLMPRVMGPHAYGEYALLLSIVVMSTAMTELGIGQICGRFVPQLELLGDPRPLQRLVTGLLTAKLALDALIVGPLFVLLWETYGDRFPATYFVLAISTLVVLDLGTVPYGLMFGLNRLNLYALRDPLRRALNLVPVLVLYHYFGLYGALMSTFVVEASLTALNLAWGWRFFRIQDFRLDLAFLKPYLRFGFVFYLSMGVKTIGYLVPIFMRLLATGKEEKLAVWSSLLLKYIFALSILTVGGFLITGRELIPVLIGRNYADVYPNAVVLLLGIFPMAVVQHGYVFCLVYSKAWKYLQALVYALVAFVPAAFILVPRLASMGAALAMLISTIVAAVALGVTFWARVVPCLREGMPVVLLGVTFVPFWFLRRDLTIDLLLAAVAGGFYLTALLFTQSLRTAEISEVLRAIRVRPEPRMAGLDSRVVEQ